MHRTELFLAAAQHLQDDPETMHYGERERVEALDREVRERAAALVDRVFEKFSGESCQTNDNPATIRRFSGEEYKDGVWSGEWSVCNSSDGYSCTELSRRWIKFEEPAVDIDILVPKGHNFTTNVVVVVGTHDLVVRRGKDRLREDRFRAIGLEVLTRLIALPVRNAWSEESEDEESKEPEDEWPPNPFKAMRGFHERPDCRFAPNEYNTPVFNDPEQLRQWGFGGALELRSHPAPSGHIDAINATLCWLDEALI